MVLKDKRAGPGSETIRILGSYSLPLIISLPLDMLVSFFPFTNWSPCNFSFHLTKTTALAQRPAQDLFS